MAHETQLALTPEEIHAWRSACVPPFEKIASAIFLRAKAYYVIPDPDPVRPLMSAGIAHALDQLFNPAFYPEGMTKEAVLQDAAPRMEACLMKFFAPHQETMLLHGKRNYRKGQPSTNMSWEDIDRSMALCSHHFAEAMHAAGNEVGLDLPAYQESECGLRSASPLAAYGSFQRILQAEPNMLPEIPRR